MESSDSPENPDRGKTSYIPGLSSGAEEEGKKERENERKESDEENEHNLTATCTGVKIYTR